MANGALRRSGKVRPTSPYGRPNGNGNGNGAAHAQGEAATSSSSVQLPNS
jgi:hypothetical protein